jgi:hypothetical protein
MKRTPLRRRAQLRVRTPLRRATPLARTVSLAATDSQRLAVAGRPCIVCGATTGVDPAHLIPRSLGGCGDPLCVVPLCRRPWRLRLRRAGPTAAPRARLAGAARACRRARWADRRPAADQRQPRAALSASARFMGRALRWTARARSSASSRTAVGTSGTPADTDPFDAPRPHGLRPRSRATGALGGRSRCGERRGRRSLRRHRT